MSSPDFTHPTVQEHDCLIQDFKFHTGEVLPELKLHYTSIGSPTGEPILILHGTLGSGAGLLNPKFGGELFGPGQLFDANQYFIILPDAIGTGKSSKPSDGLRMRFPKYNYDDMVTAQHHLVTEHLGIQRLRAILGYSMGGMHVWQWAQQFPDMMDIAVPMASLPTEMSGRNWIMRRLIIDSIRNDPDWLQGNYLQQPASLQFASAFYSMATNGGNMAMAKAANTRANADALLNAKLTEPFDGDANDHLYQWSASEDYNAAAGLERISAALLAINSADDERYPIENGVLEREILRIQHGKSFTIPASELTCGHGTAAQAKFWKHELADFFQQHPAKS
ncbi:MAG TPA: alpha/beta fold hydrolase [Burkholderiaceae bacterium]|nr:alpha/beta fold hydrolase [Burkholderiaceae bacterium]